MGDPRQTVWTIGHSTLTLEAFISLLRAHQIQTLADVRLLPGSRRFPHFNSDDLAASLSQAGIEYNHFRELGGRRKPRPDSHNTAWRNESFRGYADYMETQEFKKGIEKLEAIAQHERAAYLCSEAVW